MSAYSFSDFLKGHQPQLEAGCIPPEQWGSLYKKLMTEVFDAGDSFRIVQAEQEYGEFSFDVVATRDMHPVDEDCVFLIDHTWTFRPHMMRAMLKQQEGLLERIKNMICVQNKCTSEESDCSDDVVTNVEAEEAKVQKKIDDAGDMASSLPRHESVDARLCQKVFTPPLEVDDVGEVMKAMWKLANTYTVKQSQTIDEENQPVWYLMDEFGSHVQHCDTPNAHVVPIFFIPQGIAYNVLYLLKEVKEDDFITRDYVVNPLVRQKPELRKYLLLPWRTEDFSGESIKREGLNPEFFMSGRTLDALPTQEHQDIAKSIAHNKGKLRIFADDTQLVQHLSLDYELVTDINDADIIWLMKHFHDYDKLCIENPRGLVNQFPNEGCLTVKDLLSAILMQYNDAEGPRWFQTSFNLNYELPQFVSYYQKQQKIGADSNVWIVKPWNLARGMDMHVTNDLGHIIRLMEASPKIACKYIERPLLFHRSDSGNKVKFDLRYILFVNSLQPVEAYVYNNFWIRFAINDFHLDCLDDLETHFTVFNYADKSKILQMDCSNFIQKIENDYPFLEWANIQSQINKVLKGLLEAVSKNESPCGVVSNVQSRAMYGVDIMLQWSDLEEEDVQVTLLECNFMPDCERACQYYPDFADVAFKTMFLGDIDSAKVTCL